MLNPMTLERLYLAMNNHSRLKNKYIAKLVTRFPVLAKRFINSYTPCEFEDIPWTPLTKPLKQSRVAMVTTSGVHHTHQKPFNMHDPHGDPTFRIIDSVRLTTDWTITHDYYDHRDATKDINVVLPFERLKEFEREQLIGSVAERHYSFMGHIVGPYIYVLTNHYAKEVAVRLWEDHVDVVVLTPG